MGNTKRIGVKGIGSMKERTQDEWAELYRKTRNERDKFSLDLFSINRKVIDLEQSVEELKGMEKVVKYLKEIIIESMNKGE